MSRWDFSLLIGEQLVVLSELSLTVPLTVSDFSRPSRMCFRIITTLALVASASAFTAPAPQARAASMVGALSDYAGVSFETGDAVWDPLGFGSMSEKIKGGEHDSVMPDAKWLREAELKHCRGAMLAFVGTCVAVNGITFPGELGGYHYEAGTWYEGLSNAMATNTFGMAQLFLSIGLVEVMRSRSCKLACMFMRMLLIASGARARVT